MQTIKKKEFGKKEKKSHLGDSNLDTLLYAWLILIAFPSTESSGVGSNELSGFLRPTRLSSVPASCDIM